MRAVVLEGEGSVVVENVPDAALPGPDGAVVVVGKAAICGSDLHLYHGALNDTRIRLGHEAIGTVEAIGSDVRTLTKGQRVLVSAVIGCGRCPACRQGDPVRCHNDEAAAFGTTPDLAGSQAEAVAVPSADLHAIPIPDGVDDEQALLLTDALPTGYLGARRADIRPGTTVVVIGLGPVGLMALQCAQLFGPARVLAVDTVPQRLHRAGALGAQPMDASSGTTVNAVLEATDGRGAESVIEAVGLERTILDAISCTAAGGTVSVVGVNLDMELPFPMALAFLRSLTVRATFASIPGTWETLVPLVVAGRLQLDGVFTHRLGLSEAAEAYRIFDTRSDGVLKVMLDPAG